MIDTTLEWIAAHPARFVGGWLPLAILVAGLLDSAR
jgi:hypothetical protein